MRLRALGDYSSSRGSFRAGAEVHVPDDVGEFLLRDSPGTFERLDAPPGEGVSAATATGVVAPDRQARGGRAR